MRPAEQTLAQVIPEESARARPLRIALLGYRSAPHTGGQGVYLRQLSRALVASGHDVTVISGPPYPLLDDGIDLVKLPSLDLYAAGLGAVGPAQLCTDRLARAEWLSKLTGGFAEPWTFAERARDYLLPRLHEFDVIHDNQTLADGVLDLQRAGANLVTTIHHPITRDRRHALEQAANWRQRLLVRRWYRFVHMQARVAQQLDRVVTVSGPSYRDICTDFGVDSRRMSIVPPGVDLTVFRPLPEVSREPLRLITTASADAPLKGLDILLKALAQLRTTVGDVRLTLIGRPKADGVSQRLITDLNLQDAIECHSGLSDEDMVHCYARASVAVVPSRYEGFGLPAIEAMACGVPLVSSNGGALPEVVQDAALLFQVGDDAALARQVALLLGAENLRADYAERGLKRVASEYSWASCADRLVALYRAGLSPC